MKRILITLVSILITSIAFSQTEQKLDTIYMLGQRKKVVDIKRITYSKVIYQEKDNKKNKEMEKKQIQRVIFHTGRKEVFNDPLVMDVEEHSWKNVVLTKEESDVKGLYKLGKVHGKSSSRNRTPKSAERTATIRVKRRAANEGAQMVLITKKESTGGFGEVPTYYIEGIAYSFTKPKKEDEDD